MLKQCYYSHIFDQFEFSYFGGVVVFLIRSIRKIGDWVWTEKQQRVSHSLSCEDSVIKIGRKTSGNSCLYFSHLWHVDFCQGSLSIVHISIIPWNANWLLSSPTVCGLKKCVLWNNIDNHKFQVMFIHSYVQIKAFTCQNVIPW